MAGIAAAILGAGAIGAIGSIGGAFLQSNAANNAINAQQAMFAQAQANEAPFIQAGQKAIPTLQSLITPGPDQTAMLQQTPGYQFAANMAQQGVSNQGTVTGLGGNTLLAGANAATQVALGQSWLPTVNALQALMQTGAQTAGNLGQQAVQTGQNVGQNLVGIGNAQAGAGTAVGANIGNSLVGASLAKLLGTSMYGNAADAGKAGPGGIGTGGYNFLDAMA